MSEAGSPDRPQLDTSLVPSRAPAPPTPSYEERLQLGASDWSEERIAAALVEPLPEGWSAVRDDQGAEGVYYWNELTDQTTWLKPVTPATESVQRAKSHIDRIEAAEPVRAATFRRRPSPGVLSERMTAAGGATTVHWPPLPASRRLPQLSWRAQRPKPTPAALVQLDTGELRSLLERVRLGTVAANRVLERVGKLEKPPPPPPTTKELTLQHHRNHDPDFDDAMWQWKQGKWTHLPPPTRMVREVIHLRSSRCTRLQRISRATPIVVSPDRLATAAAAAAAARAACAIATAAPSRAAAAASAIAAAASSPAAAALASGPACESVDVEAGRPLQDAAGSASGAGIAFEAAPVSGDGSDARAPTRGDGDGEDDGYSDDEYVEIDVEVAAVRAKPWLEKKSSKQLLLVMMFAVMGGGCGA